MRQTDGERLRDDMPCPGPATSQDQLTPLETALGLHVQAPESQLRSITTVSLMQVLTNGSPLVVTFTCNLSSLLLDCCMLVIW